MTTASSETATRYYADDSLVYEMTGEYRPPVAGEFILWRGTPIRARHSDCTEPYPILRWLHPRDVASLLNPPPPEKCECPSRPSGSFSFGGEDVDRCPACSRVIA